MKTKNQIQTPWTLFKNRFYSNRPALIGLAVIFIFVIVAILGYTIMPDSTPNANDGAVQIQKQPFGFQIDMLKKVKSQKEIQTNFFVKLVWGEEANYTITPLKEYELKDLELHFVPFGRVQKPESMSLIQITQPLFFGFSEKYTDFHGVNYKINGEKITYIDYDENIQSTTKSAVIEKFKNFHIEKRTYWLGTDRSGRDILSRLLFGTRISLGIGFVSVLISLLVGILLGSIGGFFGGITDKIVMWFITVVWAIPSIMLVIAISLALQSKGVWVSFIAVGLTTWVEVARVVRGQIMSIKEKLFIESARALGLGNRRIIMNHILPNLIGPIVVIASSNFASAILMEAGLSFLGLGVQPPMPSWGIMINEGFHNIGSKDSLHLILVPSLAISLMVLAFNVLGNGLRDASDPRTIVK